MKSQPETGGLEGWRGSKIKENMIIRINVTSLLVRLIVRLVCYHRVGLEFSRVSDHSLSSSIRMVRLAGFVRLSVTECELSNSHNSWCYCRARQAGCRVVRCGNWSEFEHMFCYAIHYMYVP